MTTPREKEEEKKQDPSQEKQDFQDVFFQAILGAQLIQTAYIGHRLGWYTALKNAGNDGLSYQQLASSSTTHSSSQRYAQEWLEQQAVAGWIQCRNPSAASRPHERMFVLSHEHAQVLANPDSLQYSMPLAILHGGTGKRLEELVHAYKHDTGVSWDELGTDAREAQAAMNRPFFLQQFGSTLEQCLESTDTLSKLSNGGGRVADIGCGYAYSSIAVAQHFGKHCTVHGYDLDEPSIIKARDNIQKEGLQDRVQVYCKDAASVITNDSFEPYDLVMALECLHDMSNPISVLRTMKDLAGSHGTVLVMDERVADSFDEGIGNPIEQLMYGFSCTCCLADCKSHPNSAETGTVMRPSILTMYAQQAGFRQVEILPVEQTGLFYFYKLIQ
jgi:predicted O-methyltransferase YrrM